MREFFCGWRRKVACVTLGLACLFTVGWVRCQRIEDVMQISVGNADHALTSTEGVIRWAGTAHQWCYQIRESDIRWYSHVISPPTLSLVIGGGQRVEGDRPFDIGFLPYWSIVIPLTLLSVCLLLSKPRTMHPADLTKPSFSIIKVD